MLFPLAGAGVFVTTVVAGTIAIIQPFDAMQRPFLRDIIFFLAATFWAFQILWKKEITKYESIGKLLGNFIVPRLFEEKRRDTVFGIPWVVVCGSEFLVGILSP